MQSISNIFRLLIHFTFILLLFFCPLCRNRRWCSRCASPNLPRRSNGRKIRWTMNIWPARNPNVRRSIETTCVNGRITFTLFCFFMFCAGCCVYKKPHDFGESSSESEDDECDHCQGHVEQKNSKGRKNDASAS